MWFVDKAVAVFLVCVDIPYKQVVAQGWFLLEVLIFYGTLAADWINIFSDRILEHRSIYRWSPKDDSPDGIDKCRGICR